MAELKVIAIGNSVGVILPRELLVKLGVQKGDTLFAVTDPDGFKLSARSPDLDEQLAVCTPHHARACSRASRTGEVTVWLQRDVIEIIHAEQLAQHGGGVGVRDPGLLASALARPLNLAGYGDPDTAELGALYAIGLCRNHPFIDGNKRTAYVALETFLALNGVAFPVSDAEAIVAMIDLADGQMSDEEFTAWVRDHARDPAAVGPSVG